MEPPGSLPRGCCGETILNFSLLQVPDELMLTMADPSLWYTVLVVFAEPYFKPVIGVHESRNEFFTNILGRKLTFLTYVILSYMYSFWAFVFVNSVVASQPRLQHFQKNEVLIFGYILLLAGLSTKLYTYLTTSVINIMGGHYFKITNAAREADPLIDDTYYHPLGTASVVCYFGFSMVQASMAGLLLTVTLAIAYYTAFHFERYLVYKTSR
ncbi:hypothetical protein BsWGS_28783 [Bradybaena similaris]